MGGREGRTQADVDEEPTHSGDEQETDPVAVDRAGEADELDDEAGEADELDDEADELDDEDEAAETDELDEQADQAEVAEGQAPRGAAPRRAAGGFADLDFIPNPAMPVSKNVYDFAEHDCGTRATFVSTYESAEALQQVLDMGVVEGATSAINQIDRLLSHADLG